jgi:hypothetical protein
MLIYRIYLTGGANRVEGWKIMVRAWDQSPHNFFKKIISQKPGEIATLPEPCFKN